jgi:uncharacterized membrane protein YbaN (DUF454 family)
MEDSVAAKSKLPTKMFFILGSFEFDGSGKRRGRWISAKAVAGRSKTTPV